MAANSDYKVLCLSFHKNRPETVLFDFEKFLVFGLSQYVQFFANITVLDYAVPAQRLMPNPDLPPEESLLELKQMAGRFSTSHVIYGSLNADVSPEGFLQSVHLDLSVYSATLNAHLLRVRYPVREFEQAPLDASLSALNWQEFQNMLYTAAAQIIGVLLPRQAKLLWPALSTPLLPERFETFQKLAVASYLNTDRAAAQKMGLLNDLVKEAPGCFLAHLEAGRFHKRMQNYVQAILSLESAYKLMDEVLPRQRAMAATEIGICYALSEQKELACKWWMKAISDDASWLQPYMNLAHAYEENGQLDYAEKFFIRATEVAPNDVRVYFNLARLYSKQEAWDKAITQYKHQMMLEPNNAWTYSNLANCYLQKGEIAQAKTLLERTREVEPESEAGRYAGMILNCLEAVEV